MDPKFFFLYLLLSFKSFTSVDTSKNTHVQDALLMYKRIYTYGDSIKKLRKPGFVDTNVFKIEDTISKKHPYDYYRKAGELIEKFKLNDASFLYYLGSLRYGYYNSVNPNYESSGDGALAASLSYEFGEPINMFLKTDINNFIAILKEVVDWYDSHDYQFYTRKNNPEKYSEQSKNMRLLIQDLEDNREKYQSKWNDEKNKLLMSIDSSLNKISK